MKIGGDLAFWVKIAIGVVAVYLLWRLYRGASAVVGIVTGGVQAAGRAAGEVVGVVGEAATRPGSVEEGEGVSAPGYGP